jgi:squalene-hopene/tetraprenyl-beta-curcumene cyclase
MRLGLPASVLLAGFASIGLADSGVEPRHAGPDQTVWNKAVDQGVTYLKSRQAEDGTWSKATSPGITGIVLDGLFLSGKVTSTDPVADKALRYLESLVEPKEGHIAGAGARIGLHNYLTCVNILAFRHSTDSAKYDSAVRKGVEYLKKLQWDESEDKKPSDPIYGGAGYGGGTRPDLSNTQFFLDALTAAGVPADDPTFKKAVIYVSRCQNLKGEYNDQPWAGLINDGSFIYGAGPAGETRGVKFEDGRRPGYGSMTFAGLKCLTRCGVAKNDPRCQKALEWVSKHYSVDINPGMAAGSGGRGLYYYLMTMSRCLQIMGIDEVVDRDGVKHDWRAEITAALANRQKKDGSWGNDIPAWMEGNTDLCTAYALIALAACKEDKK